MDTPHVGRAVARLARRHLTRRAALAAGGAGLGAALLGAGGPARARPGAQGATPAPGAAPSYVGSWHLAIADPAGPPERRALATFFADGTFLLALGPALPPWPGAAGAVALASTAHGVWVGRGGAGTATAVALLSDAQGRPLGTATFRLGLVLKADGSELRGEFGGQETDPAGARGAALRGEVTGTRVSIAEHG